MLSLTERVVSSHNAGGGGGGGGGGGEDYDWPGAATSIIFVATNTCSHTKVLSRQKTFAATKLCLSLQMFSQSRQAYFCHSRQKTCFEARQTQNTHKAFVTTKTILVAATANEVAGLRVCVCAGGGGGGGGGC